MWGHLGLLGQAANQYDDKTTVYLDVFLPAVISAAISKISIVTTAIIVVDIMKIVYILDTYCTSFFTFCPAYAR